MVAVAVVAFGLLAIEMTRRHARYLQLAAYHRSQIIAPTQSIDQRRRVVRWIDRDGKVIGKRPRLDYWHEELGMKYQLAAARPWYSVEADPPAPRPGDPLSAINRKMWPDPFAPAQAPSTVP
jgi:hypothetical protein